MFIAIPLDCESLLLLWMEVTAVMPTSFAWSGPVRSHIAGAVGRGAPGVSQSLCQNIVRGVATSFCTGNELPALRAPVYSTPVTLSPRSVSFLFRWMCTA